MRSLLKLTLVPAIVVGALSFAATDTADAQLRIGGRNWGVRIGSPSYSRWYGNNYYGGRYGNYYGSRYGNYYGNYGYASAAAYLLFVAIILLTALQFRLLREKD